MKSQKKEFKELETARRRKELEEMLSQPTKSILKRRNDSEDSPSLRVGRHDRPLINRSITIQSVMQHDRTECSNSERKSDKHNTDRL